MTTPAIMPASPSSSLFFFFFFDPPPSLSSSSSSSSPGVGVGGVGVGWLFGRGVIDVGAVVFFNLGEDGALLLGPARRAQGRRRHERRRGRRGGHGEAREGGYA